MKLKFRGCRCTWNYTVCTEFGQKFGGAVIHGTPLYMELNGTSRYNLANQLNRPDLLILQRKLITRMNEITKLTTY